MERGKKYPVKTTINLAQREVRHQDLGVVIPTAVVLAIAIGAFCKFGVVDRLNAVSHAERQASQAEQILDQLRDKTADYESVLEAYKSYTAARSAEGGVDPMECLRLIETQLIDRSRVQSFSVAPSLITVQLSGVTLNDISGMYQRLTAESSVSNVQVFTAATEADRNTKVTATMTIRLTAGDTKSSGEEAAS